MTNNLGGATTAMTFSGDHVDGNGMMTCHFTCNNGEGYYPADNGDGMLTWQLNNQGGVTTEVNGEEKSLLTWLFDGDGELTAEETKNLLTWHIHNNGEVATVNGDGYEFVTDEMKRVLTWQNEKTNGLLTCQSEFVTDEMLTCHLKQNEMKKSLLTWQNDDAKGMLTCPSEFVTNEKMTCQSNGYGEVVTDELLTWQNNEDEAEELSKFLEASTGEMLTCQKPKVKIINDYPYWIPLKFQTSSAYVTINGNEELCGSSFSDSETSYMAGISGAWCGVAEEAREVVEWGECEDEMLATFLGE